MGRKSLAIRMTAPLQELFTTAEIVALEEVSFSYTQNPKTVS